VNNRDPLNKDEIPYVFNTEDAEKYNNPIDIEGQWGGTGMSSYHYGIGDPFVMKYNGYYYLYPSTEGPNAGIKVFQSKDMVNWEYKGFCVASSDASTVNAYAPEVIYYQGYFYLCQSKGGSGHYFYRATSPLGPFTKMTDNLGNGIDGTFHINDDGRLYFIHTNVPAGLRINEVFIDNTNNTLTLSNQELVSDANLNHWIEGPGTIRRDGINYLTYTGNHVVSIGYRVAYSYTRDANITASSFIQPTNNVTLISTKSSYSGLGHSSNAYGPDLDSIYTAYHNRDFYGRRYNLDRYLTNGSRLTSNGAYDFNTITPSRPVFETNDANGLDNYEGFYLTPTKALSYYTAEFNAVYSNGGILLNYQDSQNYLKLAILSNNTASLISIKNGVSTTLTTASIPSTNLESLASVRVEKDLEKFRIYINEMLVLTYNTSEYNNESYLGYYGEVDINYTAYTNDVNGSSDYEVIKNIPSSIGAQTYLKGEFRGYYFSNPLTNDLVRNGEKNSIYKSNDQYSVLLNTKEDFVKYPINVNINTISTTYSLVVEINKASLGSHIEVVVGENKVYSFYVPKDISFKDNEGEEVEFVRVYLGDLLLDPGYTTIKFRLYSGEFNFRQFYLYEDADLVELDNVHNLELKEKINQVASGIYLQNEDHIESIDNGIFMGLYGNNGASNFVYSVDVAFLYGSSGEGGIVFRTKNYSYHKDQPTQSFQGYFFQIKDRVGTLSRYDYGTTTLAICSLKDDNNNAIFSSYSFHNVKVECYNNLIKIYVDNNLVIEYTDVDQFMDGYIGFYSRNMAFAYKNLSYKKL